MENLNDKGPELAIEYIFKHGKRYAKARADRIYLEEYRKSLKAILMKRSLENAVNAQEREAYSDPEYVKLLQGLKEAVEVEESSVAIIPEPEAMIVAVRCVPENRSWIPL